MTPTQIVVPLQHLDYGFRFPHVCVKTGRPAQTLVKVQLRWSPAWTIVFLILGPIPYIIAALVAGKRRDVELPATLAVAKRRRLLVSLAWTSFFFSLLAMFGMIASDWFGFVLLALLVASIGLGMTASLLWITQRLGQHELMLRRVHPNFTRAVHEYQSQIAAWQAGQLPVAGWETASTHQGFQQPAAPVARPYGTPPPPPPPPL